MKRSVKIYWTLCKYMKSSTVHFEIVNCIFLLFLWRRLNWMSNKKTTSFMSAVFKLKQNSDGAVIESEKFIKLSRNK